MGKPSKRYTAFGTTGTLEELHALYSTVTISTVRSRLNRGWKGGIEAALTDPASPMGSKRKNNPWSFLNTMEIKNQEALLERRAAAEARTDER